MKPTVVLFAALAALALAGCAQTPPAAPSGPPVANATPPPLPPDPALGAHATQGQAAGTRPPGAPAPR
jgi:flagellar basal body L-ring protein FlgH